MVRKFLILALTIAAAGYFAHPEVVALLLAKGANWNLQNKQGLTARDEGVQLVLKTA